MRLVRRAPHVGEHERLAVAGDAFGRAVERHERDPEHAADRPVAEHAAVARPHGGDRRRRGRGQRDVTNGAGRRRPCRPSRRSLPGAGPPFAARAVPVTSASTTSADAISLSMVGLLSAVSPPLRRSRRSGSLDLLEPDGRTDDMNRRELLAAAAAPLALALVPPAFARRRGGTALALVTADLEAAIVAVDLSNGEIHAPAEDARRPPQHREHRREGRPRRAHRARPAHTGRRAPARAPDRRGLRGTALHGRLTGPSGSRT